MKRILLILTIITVAGLSLSAQSLRDNPDYLKSLELQEQSRQAFDDGEYARAEQLAKEAKEYAEKSELWIAEQLARYRANSALLQVRNRFEEIDRFNAKATYPDEYASAKLLYDQAYQEFRNQTWAKSQESSKAALNAMKSITFVQKSTLPAFYVVQRLTGQKDSLWKIAGYQFIYGDSWSWRTLYNANKDKLPSMDNPHLILPGMKLTIPARSGETRSGTWENGKIR